MYLKTGPISLRTPRILPRADTVFASQMNGLVNIMIQLFVIIWILWMNIEYVYSVAVYQKYLTKLGELIMFEPWRENYHFSQPI